MPPTDAPLGTEPTEPAAFPDPRGASGPLVQLEREVALKLLDQSHREALTEARALAALSRAPGVLASTVNGFERWMASMRARVDGEG